MTMYQCERCGEYRNDDYDVCQVTRLKHEHSDVLTCEYCASELEERFENGLLDYVVIDGTTYRPGMRNA